MSVGLLEQLDIYFDQVDASQTPVTEAEVKDRLWEVPFTSAKRPGGHRGLLVGLAVAAAVMAIGSIALLTRQTAPETPVLSQPSPSPTVATPAPVTGTWSRVPRDEAVFGGDGDQGMGSVTGGGPGLVAVGGDGGDAVVWTSVDGVTWSRVPDEESLFAGWTMASITVGGPGLVAVGYDTGPSLAATSAVWTSVDGIAWSRVAHDEAVFGGAAMFSVTVGGPGLVAVGQTEGPRTDEDAVVWTSVDGTTWTRVAHDEMVFGGEGAQRMTSVTAGGPGLVAVGWREYFHSEYVSLSAAVWTSPDGFTWSQVPHDKSVFGGVPRDVGGTGMSSVTAGGPGLVAVGGWGYDSVEDAVLWTSPDGFTWSQVPHDETAFGGAVVSSVTATGPGLVAVGTRDSRSGPDAAVWTSVDGINWTRVPQDEALGTGLMWDLINTDSGLVAVGSDGTNAAVWVAGLED